MAMQDVDKDKEQERTLYHVIPHPKHIRVEPRNVNAVHKAQTTASLNARIAIALTKSVGTMQTAYFFTFLAIIGLLGILGLLNPIVVLLVAWTSQTLIQLVLLPVIMVGQNILGSHAEIQANEQYNTTIKTYHDIEQIMRHLDKQDEHIIAILKHVETMQQDQVQVEAVGNGKKQQQQQTAKKQHSASTKTP